jgi:hypothetical protein
MSANRLTPRQHAELLRREAETTKGERRNYLLWLAAEWGKSADRYAQAGSET